MPTLNIGGKRVKVGDEFLKLSPEDQQKTVNEIAGKIGITSSAAAPAPSPVAAGSQVAGGAADDVHGDGLVANAAAGLGEINYGIAGLPGDMLRTGINALTQPNAVADNIPGIGPILHATQSLSQMAGIPEIPATALGSQAIAKDVTAATNGAVADPYQTKAVTLPEKIIRAGTGAAAMTIAPEAMLGILGKAGVEAPKALAFLQSMFGEAKSVPGMVRNAVAGGTAGAGSAVGQELAPAPLKPLAGALGALVGGGAAAAALHGVPTAAGVAAEKVGQYLDPLSAAGREREVGRQLVAGASDPAAVVAAASGDTTGISGAPRTLAQVTGDKGIAGVEARAAATTPEPFQQRTAAQQAAQLDAMRNIQRTGGAETIAPAIDKHAQRLADLHAQIDAAETAKLNQAAADVAAGRKDPATAGEEMRGYLETSRTAARKAEGALHEAVDPSGTLQMQPSNLVQAQIDAQKKLSGLAKPVSGEEAAIHDTIKDLPDTIPYKDAVALQSRIADAMRAEARANGKSATWGRLSQLNSAAYDDLKNTATGVAKNEAKAVKAGEMVPEDTMAARLQGEVNGWREQRKAGTLTASGTDGGNNPGAAGPLGAPAVSGAGGTEGAALGGSGNAAGPAGLSQDARAGSVADGQPSLGLPPLAPGENVMAGPLAYKRLAAAKAATVDRVNTFDNPLLKPILKRPSGVNPYDMPATEVAARIFQPGAAGGERVSAFRQAVGDQNALPVLQEHATDAAMRYASRPDGSLDPKRLATWRSNHAEALSALPALDTKLSNATTAMESAGEVADARRQIVNEAQKSAASKLVGLTEPSDIVNKVGGIFGRADSVGQMQQLARTLRSDPQAKEGLRKAVVDHIMQKFVTSTGEELKGPALAKFLREKDATLQAAGLTRAEIDGAKGLAKELTEAEQLAKTAQSNKPETIDLLKSLFSAHVAAKSGPFSLFTHIAARAALHSVAPTIFGGPIVGGAAFLGSGLVTYLRSKGLSKVDDLLAQALLDPALARKLMVKVTPQNKRAVTMSFRHQVGRSTAAGTAGGALPNTPAPSLGRHVGNAVASVGLDQLIGAQPAYGNGETRVASR